MKYMYWRPRKTSRWTILAISLFAVAGLVMVESLRATRAAPHRAEKLAAAELADTMMRTIKAERLRKQHRIHPRLDPLQSGMVGRTTSAVTTLPANLTAKQASVNPNFGAAVVQMLLELGIRPGDVVAVGYSGSYPALNVATCAALETLQVRPIVIASAASSSYGANHPDWMWLDMEKLLYEENLISFRSSMASLGGSGDRLMGHPRRARDLAKDCVVRNGLELIEMETLRESIDLRMQSIQQLAAGEPVKAYVNVGGGAASIRGSKGKSVFQLGINSELRPEAFEVDCVASRLASEGVPIVHLGDAGRLAKKVGIDPIRAATVGAGPIFQTSTPSRWLAAGILVSLLWLMRVNLLTDTMHRIKRFIFSGQSSPHHELRIVRDEPDGPRLMV